MDKIKKLLEKNVDTIYPSKKSLEKALRSGKKLKLYLGIDPTASKLHLGHTIAIRKLNEFASLGHEAIFLVGDGTVLVGDPSERNTGRKLITPEEVKKNIRSWKKQMRPFLDFTKVKEKHNADWLTKLTLIDLIKIGSKISAVQLFKRDNFQKRLKKENTVWYHETMYPLLQGYDSVIMDVDLEIGGTDQTFNMLIGRQLQKKFNNREKYVLTTKMIMGTDNKKMSKTSNNCIWLDDSAENIYGKLMSLPDELIPSYFEAFTEAELKQVQTMEKQITKGGVNPMALKKDLAFKITRQIHGQAKAKKAEADFEKVFQQGKKPDNIPGFRVKQLSANPISPLDLLTETGLASSRSEAKRLIRQKAVKINNQPVLDYGKDIQVKADDIIQVGKKRWLKISSV
jgi:tyrosyl-tRNA synthetase